MIRGNDWIVDLHHKESIKPKYEDGDFYWDKDKMVMTEQYHIKRGNCCPPTKRVTPNLKQTNL